MNFRNPTECERSDRELAQVSGGRRAFAANALTVFFLIAVVAAGAVAGFAKQKKPLSKTVSGVVFDPEGKIIEGAAVELKDRQTGKVLDIYSQEDGSYQFTDLSFDHDYTVKATYKGASSEERQISSLDTRSRPVMNLTIPKAK